MECEVATLPTMRIQTSTEQLLTSARDKERRRSRGVIAKRSAPLCEAEFSAAKSASAFDALSPPPR